MCISLLSGTETIPLPNMPTSEGYAHLSALDYIDEPNGAIAFFGDIKKSGELYSSDFPGDIKEPCELQAGYIFRGIE